MTVASIAHIDVDDSGTARIVGQRTKVIQIVMDKMANGWSSEEIQGQYLHLSLAQIHAALAYINFAYRLADVSANWNCWLPSATPTE